MRLIVACLLMGMVVCLPGQVLAADSGGGKVAASITAEQNGKTVVVPVHAQFEVTLDGNVTTGYQWQVSPVEGQSLRQLGKGSYAPSSPRRIGSGGVFTFRFKAEKAGTMPLKFVYVRPWEKGVSPARTFTVTIEVSDKKL